MKPKIYLAGPLFNEPQVAILKSLEEACEYSKLTYFSPRLHSGSHLLTPEQRKDPKSWDPIFKSNVDALDNCDIVVAILDYAMQENVQLGIATEVQQGNGWCEVDSFSQISLPDTGTVWEMGYARSKGKLIIGLSSADALNLMLSHSVDSVGSLIEVATWLKSYSDSNYTMPAGTEYLLYRGSFVNHFNWKFKPFQGRII